MTGSEPIDFHLTDRRGAYDFVTRTLRRLNYAGLSKADKGVVRRFVAKVTGLSRAQSTRLIGQYQNTGHIRDRRCGATRPFERRYTAVDIRLLAEVDETLGGLCGPTTRRVMRRQYEVFGDERFERLAGLSNSHLYRMRQSTTYRRRRNPTTKTQATQVSIGERRKPHPQGRPGFLRVDSDQGDLAWESVMLNASTSLRRFPSKSRDFTPTTARIHQLPGGPTASQATRGGVHQVTTASLQRQRPGREQERLGGASPPATPTSRAVTPPSSVPGVSSLVTTNPPPSTCASFRALTQDVAPTTRFSRHRAP